MLRNYCFSMLAGFVFWTRSVVYRFEPIFVFLILIVLLLLFFSVETEEYVMEHLFCSFLHIGVSVQDFTCVLRCMTCTFRLFLRLPDHSSSRTKRISVKKRTLSRYTRGRKTTRVPLYCVLFPRRKLGDLGCGISKPTSVNRKLA